MVSRDNKVAEWLITLPGLEDIINADVILSLFIYETLVSPKKDSSISKPKRKSNIQLYPEWSHIYS
jgi:hypothetical protein